MNQIPKCTFEHDGSCNAMACYTSQPCGARDEQGVPCYIPKGGDKMTKSEELGLKFEALICQVHALGIEVAGMKAENKQREHLEQAMAYTEDDFKIKAEKMKKFADEFKSLHT